MPCVLLVDDHDQVRKLLETVFTRAGYEVISAPDGDDALELLRENRPDLVVTDILMPKMEGYETIIEIRRVYPDIKIIAMSGGGRNTPDSYLGFAKDFGADAVFTKPIDMRRLLETVEQLLNPETAGN
jgi:CheY-like chemotaxis protein